MPINKPTGLKVDPNPYPNGAKTRRVLGFGYPLPSLLAVLLVDGFSLVHTVIYGAHKQEHNKEKEIKVLPLSSKQEKLRYGGRKNIFGRFPNGMAEFILEMAWSNFGRIGGCLAHEMISRRSG